MEHWIESLKGRLNSAREELEASQHMHAPVSAVREIVDVLLAMLTGPPAPDCAPMLGEPQELANLPADGAVGLSTETA